MGIEVILYDPSPVVQKIFFHVLYHYGPAVHRIDQAPALIDRLKYKRPDIIFVDDTFQDNLKDQIESKAEEFKDIPLILMSKAEMSEEILEQFTARAFLKKPISAEKLRDIVNRFVPKTRKHLLAKNLEFPSIPGFQEDSKKEEGLSTKANEMGGEKLPVEENHLLFEGESARPEEEEAQGIDPATFTQIKTVADLSVAGKPLLPERDEVAGEYGKTEALPIEEGSAQKTPPEGGDKASERSPAEAKAPEEAKIPKREQGIDPATFTQIKKMEDMDMPVSSKPLVPEKNDPVAGKPLVPEKSYPQDEKPKPELDTALKNQIKDFIHKQAETSIKEEIQNQLKSFVEQKSGEIIQKTAEKAVWQVLPELAKQLITKELDKLLKEEEMEKEIEEEIKKESGEE